MISCQNNLIEISDSNRSQWHLFECYFLEAKQTCGQQYFPVKEPIVFKICNSWWRDIAVIVAYRLLESNFENNAGNKHETKVVTITAFLMKVIKKRERLRKKKDFNKIQHK